MVLTTLSFSILALEVNYNNAFFHIICTAYILCIDSVHMCLKVFYIALSYFNLIYISECKFICGKYAKDKCFK